jgi:hypothetical protein
VKCQECGAEVETNAHHCWDSCEAVKLTAALAAKDAELEETRRELKRFVGVSCAGCTNYMIHGFCEHTYTRAVERAVEAELALVRMTSFHDDELAERKYHEARAERLRAALEFYFDCSPSENRKAWRLAGYALGRLVWQCDACSHVEPAEEPYDVGDSEPCVHCESGTATVAALAESAPEAGKKEGGT